MKILNSKKTGLSIKYSRFIIVRLLFVMALMAFSCNLIACDPAPEAAHIECGLHLDIDLPRGVDSIHVVISKNDSIYHVYRDTIPCSKCYEKHVWVDIDEKKLKREWGYGQYSVEEIAYCGGKMSVFPAVSVTLKESFYGLMDVRYDGYSNDLYKPYIPVQDGCNIDSTYKISIFNEDNCID